MFAFGGDNVVQLFIDRRFVSGWCWNRLPEALNGLVSPWINLQQASRDQLSVGDLEAVACELVLSLSIRPTYLHVQSFRDWTRTFRHDYWLDLQTCWKVTAEPCIASSTREMFSSTSPSPNFFHFVNPPIFSWEKRLPSLYGVDAPANIDWVGTEVRNSETDKKIS
jgi:hypothetical protein